MNIQDKLPILVLGGSGQLGCHIIQELLNIPTFSVSALVKDPSRCENVLSKIEQSGGRVITGDVTNAESIRDATKGIHTVISALEGGEDVRFYGQLNVLNDGLKNNIQRFVPSDYSVNFWKIPLGTNYCVDLHLKFRKELEKQSDKVKGLYFTTGLFMENYFTLVDKDGFLYWENPSKKIELTSIDDVAKFVAQGVKDPNCWGDVMVYSTQKTIKEVQEIYNQITGKNLELRNMGSLNDLKELIKKAKQEGNTYDALRFGFYYLIFGENPLIPDRMNEKWDVKPIPLEEYLNRTKGKPMIDLHLFEVGKNIPKENLLSYSY